ncbi:MAG: nucleotidyl transferase AbiEii/AbiGii toxin family protein [Myxococcales bacterium]|nr:nucleotidyl transferase AbiEii/AbiGii toxin family protein [Myxococcales bacterium]HIM02272.1 nucleotidyl transferase AbiEii/AbiGii toxin family protein [Myxococcales bacterium]
MSGNVAASVHARLANRARADDRPFQELLQYYGLERFLYRISKSDYRDRFVLKGALMLRVWDAPMTRPTRDIDFLGYTENSIDSLEDIVRAICALEVEDDGLGFDPQGVKGERIKEDADYEGVRIKFTGLLENAKIPMQIDIAFDDVVFPDIEESAYPTLLSYPAPILRMYPCETVVAEKFQAMVYLGTINSRMKDFYDVWWLSRRFDFDGATLAEAISRTFANRGTKIDLDPVCFRSEFFEANRAVTQWQAFLKKGPGVDAPSTLGGVAGQLREFLLPVVEALGKTRRFEGRWGAPGPWS